MTIEISGANLTMILTMIGFLLTLAIAIWGFHYRTHSKINDKIDGLTSDFAELNARIAWIEGRTYQYVADQRDRQERDASYRGGQDSVKRTESQNKKEG